MNHVPYHPTNNLYGSPTSVTTSSRRRARLFDDIYEKIELIGRGTYGQVWKGREKHSNRLVALKKIRLDKEREGFPITAIREIKILRKLKDMPNIVQLLDIVSSKRGSTYMVFEYMDHDLTGLIESPHSKFFTVPQIKCYMKQVLEGLQDCHRMKILHRDIKGANILINNRGEVKLADFGLARMYKAGGRYTNHVITLWYRPPELLLGETSYDTSADMWSVGCILAELLHGKPIFRGENDIHQLELIFQLCSTPTLENWPEHVNLPWIKHTKQKKVYPRTLKQQFSEFPPQGLDLVDRLLQLDPAKRLSASEALNHHFFHTDPLPCKPEELPRYDESYHEYKTKKRKHELRKQQQHNKRRHVHKQQQMAPSTDLDVPTLPKFSLSRSMNSQSQSSLKPSQHNRPLSRT